MAKKINQKSPGKARSAPLIQRHSLIGESPTNRDNATARRVFNSERLSVYPPREGLHLTNLNSKSSSKRPRDDDTPKPSSKRTSTKCSTSHQQPPSPLSADRYRNVPFDLYEHKVMALCTQLWPKAAGENRITLKPLRGGSYNRIINVTVLPRLGSEDYANAYHHASDLDAQECNYEPLEYILRIPRGDNVEWIEQEVATNRLAGDLGVPVARVVHFDARKNNPLGSAYTVMEKVSGERLDSIFHTFRHTEKMEVAKQLGEIMIKLQSRRFPCLGILDPESYLNNGEQLSFLKLEAPNRSTIRRRDWKLPGRAEMTSAGEALAEQLLKLGLDVLCDIAIQMHAEGIFDRDVKGRSDYYLCHLDLYPRNIMVDRSPSGGGPKITAILDWDMAAFMPKSRSCPAPMWLWTDAEVLKELGERNEILVKDEPICPFQNDIKQGFLEAVGSDYMEYMQSTSAMYGRRLLDLAYFGIWDKTDEELKDSVIQYWDRYLSHWAQDCS